MNATLLAWLASCNKDPVAFVMGAFPWGMKDTSLEHFQGPQAWQLELLTQIAEGLLTPDEAIQIARASGHGIGKSALVSWIILWAFSTAPDTRGIVTANTEAQLKTKTWAELGKWFNLFIAKAHFDLTATALFSKDPSRNLTWRIDMVPWSEKNPAAFAGLHNKGKRLLLIFDEASEISDLIWEVAEGALTDKDTEILWLVFGNPTKNSGRFKECFEGGQFAHTWKSKKIDSRSVSGEITNLKLFQKWERDYGEDSDFFRVRVKGEFPRVGFMEFFSATDVENAMAREATSDRSDPLVLGVDVARFGSNNSVIWPVKGRDARTIERRVFNGLNTIELALRINDAKSEFDPDGILIDGGGVGGGVVDNCRNMAIDCFEVQFGAKPQNTGYATGATGEKYANWRSEMYGNLRQWLKGAAIPNEPELKRAFMAIRYTFNKKDEIQLVSKEDILKDNPGLILDDLDALAICRAMPVQKKASTNSGFARQQNVAVHEYDPYSPERMAS